MAADAMDSTTRDRLGGSFTDNAADYAASRPPYPAQAVDWMVGLTPSAVLELGAGAGALTQLMAAAGHRVVATDPSAGMLTELARRSASTPAAVQCAAEQLPFATGSFDAVAAATAFHWFDQRRSLPEVARVLRPEGVLALTWNTREEATPFAERLGDLLRSVQPSTLSGDWGTGSVTGVEETGLFEPPDYAEFPFSQPLSRESLVALVKSRSYVSLLGDRERHRLFDDIRRLFDETATTGGNIELPYRAQCWRMTRT